MPEASLSDGPTIFKQRQRAAWSAGNWDEMSNLITPVGEVVLGVADLEPGMDVLDVGTGSGNNIAIPAALRGANVVGADLTPELFENARRRAAEAGVEIEWVEGDAEDLPFEDASFDRVFSTFGHMFAPRHAVAAAELARVCRPGGRIVTSTWTPEGSAGQMFMTMGKYLPPPPEGVEPPVAWGNEEHARAMYEPHGLELTFARHTLVVEFPSVEADVEFMESNFGPMVMAKAALGERWPELRAEFVAMIHQHNQATDGSVRFPQEYLLTIARKPGG